MVLYDSRVICMYLGLRSGRRGRGLSGVRQRRNFLALRNEALGIGLTDLLITLIIERNREQKQRSEEMRKVIAQKCRDPACRHDGRASGAACETVSTSGISRSAARSPTPISASPSSSGASASPRSPPGTTRRPQGRPFRHRLRRRRYRPKKLGNEAMLHSWKIGDIKVSSIVEYCGPTHDPKLRLRRHGPCQVRCDPTPLPPGTLLSGERQVQHRLPDLGGRGRRLVHMSSTAASATAKQRLFERVNNLNTLFPFLARGGWRHARKSPIW